MELVKEFKNPNDSEDGFYSETFINPLYQQCKHTTVNIERDFLKSSENV